MVQSITKQPPKTGGDDLDDGLELDPDLLASSDIEDASDAESDADMEGDDAEETAAPRESSSGAAFVLEGEEDEILMSPVLEGKKRKALEVEETAEDEGEGDSADAKAADKKRRKKEKEKERKAKKRQNASDAAPNASNAPTHLSSGDLSALLLRSIRESFPSASAMELEEIVLPEDSLLPPPSYPSPKADPGNPFKPLQQRIESITKPLHNRKLVNGTPQVIVLALSGLRCADVVRGVRDVKGKGEVAKLFAKHFKLADQIKYLEKTKTTIAVGTPARVGKLLAEGALNITKDTVLLLDVSHQDSKTRTILTLPEVRDELWKSVFGGSARKALLEGGARVGAF
ncbi:hypothetical protein IAT38_000761 [Cryptococcus sp. DSM 104549]